VSAVPPGWTAGRSAPLLREWHKVTSTEDFVEFAEAAAPQLRRTAFLLCGNWHTAEDLAQTALAKVFVSWRKITRRDAVHAYATRTLVNCYLADRRLKRAVEVLTDHFPERAVAGPSVENRLLVLAALAMLPPKSRAVVVLRYWADMSVEQVADVLGCSASNVRSQSTRALGKLRVVLGDAVDDINPDGLTRRRHELKDASDG
jgi:RNA polymerase sigma-70 factor (sigma-E family)